MLYNTNESSKFILALYECSFLSKSFFIEMCTTGYDYSSIVWHPQPYGMGNSMQHTVHSIHKLMSFGSMYGGGNPSSWSISTALPKTFSRIFIQKKCDSEHLNLSKPKELKEDEVYEIDEFPNTCSVSNFIQHMLKNRDLRNVSIELHTFDNDDECERYIALKNAEV